MPTHYKGSRDEERALNTYIVMVRAVSSLQDHLQSTLVASGVTERQFAVLEALHHLGALQQGELAQKLLCTPGNITSLLRNLERDGLIKRVEKRSDRRCHSVSLTPKGESLVKRIFPAHVARLVKAFSSLTATEQENLKTLSRKFGLSLSKLKK